MAVGFVGKGQLDSAEVGFPAKLVASWRHVITRVRPAFLRTY